MTVGRAQRVVGLHVIGPMADEMIQGFAVAVRMGCTARDLHACVAIHPTMSEEAVTIKWGKDAANRAVVLPPYLDRSAPLGAGSAARALALGGAVAALAFLAGRLSRR